MIIKHVCEDNYLELDEPTLKMVEEAVSNCMDCSEMGTIVSEKVFTVYDYLQSILSHFAKMLNEKTGKKVEIDVEDAKELLSLCAANYTKVPLVYYNLSKSYTEAIEKAESEEKILKAGSSEHIDFLTKQANKETEDLNALRAEGTFKLSPETVKWL